MVAGKQNKTYICSLSDIYSMWEKEHHNREIELNINVFTMPKYIKLTLSSSVCEIYSKWETEQW